jgi:hypothetical protein
VQRSHLHARGGMRHSAPSRSNSFHSAHRNSPGRTKVNGSSRSPNSVDKSPRYSSIARSNSPMRGGSVMAADFVCKLPQWLPEDPRLDLARRVRSPRRSERHFQVGPAALSNHRPRRQEIQKCCKIRHLRCTLRRGEARWEGVKPCNGSLGWNRIESYLFESSTIHAKVSGRYPNFPRDPVALVRAAENSMSVHQAAAIGFATAVLWLRSRQS